MYDFPECNFLIPRDQLFDCMQQDLQDTTWRMQNASPASEGVVAQVQGLQDEAAGEALWQGAHKAIAASREAVERLCEHAKALRNAARGMEVVSRARQSLHIRLPASFSGSGLVRSLLPAVNLSSNIAHTSKLRKAARGQGKLENAYQTSHLKLPASFPKVATWGF